MNKQQIEESHRALVAYLNAYNNSMYQAKLDNRLREQKELEWWNKRKEMLKL